MSLLTENPEKDEVVLYYWPSRDLLPKQVDFQIL